MTEDKDSKKPKETLHAPKVDETPKDSKTEPSTKSSLSISDLLKETTVPANKTVPKSELDAAIQNVKSNKSLFESESEKEKERELLKEK